MRRISARHARPGMVLGRPLLDSYGNTVLPAGTTLCQESLMALAVHGVREVLVEDQRLEDVAVQPLVPPEVEAQAARALRDLLAECRGARTLDEGLLYQADGPVYSMVRELFPAVVGEASASGCSSLEEYESVQPVKVAGLSLLLGRRMGMGMVELAALGTAALLKDVGCLRLPRGLADSPEPLGPEPGPEARRHPELGAAMLRGCKHLSPHVAMAVLQHHERWDGSGYPSGLKGGQISTMARVIAVADAYYALVSERPHRPRPCPTRLWRSSWPAAATSWTRRWSTSSPGACPSTPPGSPLGSAPARRGWSPTATPGYGLRRSFQCGSCGEQGLPAVPARCTRCGHESWWGWWPQAS